MSACVAPVLQSESAAYSRTAYAYGVIFAEELGLGLGLAYAWSNLGRRMRWVGYVVSNISYLPVTSHMSTNRVCYVARFDVWNYLSDTSKWLHNYQSIIEHMIM